MNRRPLTTVKRLAVLLSLAVAGPLAFAGTASADNITLQQAKSKCRTRRSASSTTRRTPYTNANVKSVNAFSGHNHYVRCTVSYDTATDGTRRKRYACIETLDVYLLAHSGDRTRTMFIGAHPRARAAGGS